MSGREMIWLGARLNQQGEITDQQMIDLLTEADLDDYGKLTVTRMIGSLFIRNHEASVNIVHVGIIKVSGNATAATIADVKSDVSAPWLFRKSFFLDVFEGRTTNVLSRAADAVCGYDGPAHFDIRSQRKIGRNEKLVVVTDDEQGGYAFGFDIRALVKLG